MACTVICTKHQKESFANALKHFVELDIALLLSPRKEDSFNRSTINMDRFNYDECRFKLAGMKEYNEDSVKQSKK